MEKDVLNRKIVSLVCKNPGITIACIVESIFDKTTRSPSKTTIRRRIRRLCAAGYLSLRHKIVVFPTPKGQKSISVMADGRPSPEA